MPMTGNPETGSPTIKPPRTAIRKLRGMIAAGAIITLGLFAVAGITTPAATAAPTCLGMKATKVSSAKRIVGKKGHDVIVAIGRGEKAIYGLGGNDRICGGPGPERIFGGRGNDRLHGGGGDDELEGFRGNDKLDGGGGDDLLRGNRGNDRMSGGPGQDSIEGVNGDDTLIGDAGGDRLNGGPGTDRLLGGSGDDTLLGESGGDYLDGGTGQDIGSWSSAPNGVRVNLAFRGVQTTRDGDDTLREIEDVVGSAFPDELYGNDLDNRIDGGAGYDRLDGRGGQDEAFGGPDGADCFDFEKMNDCGGSSMPDSASVVILSRGLDGNTFIVNGDDSDNQLTISRDPNSLKVIEEGEDPLEAGSGCVTSGPRAASCPFSGKLTSILMTGNDGDDLLKVGPGFGSRLGARINGGDGSDTLIGGPEDDFLEAGYPYRPYFEGGPTTGRDRLYGDGGDDGLFADLGSDLLSGGKGADLLVSSKDVCQGHRLDGGPGQDNASWAQVGVKGGDFRMRMEIGGAGGPISLCPEDLDEVGSNIESLEGSRLDDVLIGDGGSNSFYGQSGSDSFFGNGGKDFIDARDNERDRKIDCGGRGAALVDSRDPAPIRCG